MYVKCPIYHITGEDESFYCKIRRLIDERTFQISEPGCRFCDNLFVYARKSVQTQNRKPKFINSRPKLGISTNRRVYQVQVRSLKYLTRITGDYLIDAVAHCIHCFDNGRGQRWPKSAFSRPVETEC